MNHLLYIDLLTTSVFMHRYCIFFPITISWKHVFEPLEIFINNNINNKNEWLRFYSQSQNHENPSLFLPATQDNQSNIKAPTVHSMTTGRRNFVTT